MKWSFSHMFLLLSPLSYGIDLVVNRGIWDTEGNFHLGLSNYVPCLVSGNVKLGLVFGEFFCFKKLLMKIDKLIG